MKTTDSHPGRGALILIIAAVLLANSSSQSENTPATNVANVADSQQPSHQTAKEPTLIPRHVLFGNPQKSQARLSPNGRWLSYLAPVDGILNVWVGPTDDPSQAKPVTDDKIRDIRGHSWAYTGEHILYAQDKAGDENYHVYATNVETGETKDLTPLESIRAQIQETSEKFPNELLVGLNDRDPHLHDIWRVNIETGERELIQQNEGVAAYVTDDDFRIRFAFNFTPDGGQVLLKPRIEDETGPDAEWDEFIKVGPIDAMTTGPAGFDKSGQVLYLQDSRDRDTGALFAINLDNGEVTLVAEDPRADVGGMIVHPTEKTIQAVSFTYSRTEWKMGSPQVSGA